MPTEEQFLRGTDEPTGERIQLAAGSLRMCFEPDIGFLRYVRLGDQEILRGLYSAVRDHNWDTIAPEITGLDVNLSEQAFKVVFDVAHVAREIDFRWRGTITGGPDGRVSFEMDGEAHSSFSRNRIGFCVLHSPATVAGKPCSIEKADGTFDEGRFPEAISPNQPFEDIRAIHHEVMPGVTAEVRLEGDVFEMEDQRNWTDASYKTYCTPLALPFPVEIEKGTKVSQKVTVRLSGTPAACVDSDGEPVVLTVNPQDSGPLPAIGLGMASHGSELTQPEISELQTMHLSHLRVDVRLAEAAWEAVLERAVREAGALGIDLEVAAHVSDAASAELDSLAAGLAGLDVSVCRVLVYHVAEAVADREWVDIARERLAATGAAIVSGANAYFTELNRNRPDVVALDGVCYSLNPQVHAFDDASLMETLVAQGWTVDSTRTFTGSLPVHVSPVTLSPRFNPNSTGPEPSPGSGELPASVDTRQMSLLGAAWTVGSLKYLSESGAASVTYFETTGWKGVLETEAGSGEPFPALPSGAFPLAHVFTWFGGMKSGEVLRTVSTDPLRVDGLALRRDRWTRLLIANMSSKKQCVRVNLPGMTGSARVEALNAETVERAVSEPRRFRSRKDLRNIETGGGSLDVDIGPYSVLCVKALIGE